MKAWQIALEKRLAEPDAPAVLTRDLLSRFARGQRTQRFPASSLTYWLRQAVERNKLDVVQRGLYLNRFGTRVGVAADATAWLQADAVVSLNTVLGDAGVLNNPVHAVTAVVPLERHGPPPRLGRRATRIGNFHFFGLPRAVLEAGTDEDRLDLSGHYAHPRATPEKALLDWLYLAASPRSHRSWPPRTDLDLASLDRKRLRRLAKAAGLDQTLDAWYDNKVAQPVPPTVRPSTRKVG